ncbi:GNAT family N-acetyltransferase [Metabacillus malikii]|uniref:Acetyltransferase n=1 Tax=Metabacillus malikii TaxID=1504265 RepID=A0ABT9ZM62_9BACI|nr:GNAT family N-acetyltransferase [Metabacillus malikii]MDQ0232608.1 putative acetyltransferase [Metabacillus malikii]
MKTNNVDVIQISIEDKHILKNLYPLYLHDLSQYTVEDIDNNGQYDIDFLDDFWEKEGLIPYLIKAEGSIVGFILVQTGAYAPPTGEDFYVSEFFILRKYRRKGIGKKVIKEFFNLFSGTYLLGQLPNNIPAIQFWKSVFRTFNIEFEEFKNMELGSPYFISDSMSIINKSYSTKGARV